MLREERTLTHHHESPATCGRFWSAQGRPCDDARGFAHAGCGAARRDCGDLLDGRPESYSRARRANARPDRRWATGASWAFDSPRRPERSGAGGTRARRRRSRRARPRPSPVRVRCGGGGGRSRSSPKRAAPPRVTSRPPRSRGFPPSSTVTHLRDAPRDPQAVPRAPAHRVRANDRIRRRRRRCPRAAARHSRPLPPTPDPATVELGKIRADLGRRHAPLIVQLARAEAARAAAAAEGRGVGGTPYRPRSGASPSRRVGLPPTRATYSSSTTPPHPATGVFIVTARCAIPGRIHSRRRRDRNIVEDAQRQRRYAVRWTTPWRNYGPGRPPDDRRVQGVSRHSARPQEAIADANGLRCGHTDVSHVAELEPNSVSETVTYGR